MRLFTVSFATILLASSTFAELDLPKIMALQKELPHCSVRCIQTTAAQHNCTVVDLACQCKNMQPIIQDVTPCFVKAGCGLDDIANSAKTVFEICAVVAEGLANSSSTGANPAIPETTPVDLSAGAMSGSELKSELLLMAALAAGVAMLL